MFKKGDPPTRRELGSDLTWEPKLPLNSVPPKSEPVTREAILMLLSDAEMARLRAMEAGPPLREGEEYVDLENLAKGISRVYATTTLAVRHILPRAAVRRTTWSEICELVALRSRP